MEAIGKQHGMCGKHGMGAALLNPENLTGHAELYAQLI